MTDINEILAKLEADTRKHIKLGTDIERTRQETPSIGLNKGLAGGFGYGRIVTIHGTKSSGKSSLCLEMVGQAQHEGKTCMWVDAEKTFDPEWATRLGVDVDQLAITTTNDMYHAGDEIYAMIDAGVDLIVVDSISSLIQPSFFDKDGEFAGMEKTGKIGDFSKGLKAMIRSINYINDHTLIVFISQQTTEINATYIRKRPEGGLAVEYYSSQVVRLTSTNASKYIINGDVFVGDKVIQRPVARTVNWEVEFNKLGPQGETGSYEFYFRGDNVGVDNRKEIATLAVQSGVIERAGAWFKYYDDNAEEQKFQGERALIDALDDEEFFEELKQRVELAL